MKVFPKGMRVIHTVEGDVGRVTGYGQIVAGLQMHYVNGCEVPLPGDELAEYDESALYDAWCDEVSWHMDDPELMYRSEIDGCWYPTVAGYELDKLYADVLPREPKVWRPANYTPF